MAKVHESSGAAEEGAARGAAANTEAWVTRALNACAAAARRLREAEVPPEGLAEFVPEGRRLRVLRRPATMRPIGEVWRLGALLLGADSSADSSADYSADSSADPGPGPGAPRLYAAGRATRAAERGRPNYQDLSREDRRDLAAAALRGGYPVGFSVNFDAALLPLDAAGLLALGPDAPLGVYIAGSAEEAVGSSADPTRPTPQREVRVRWRPGAPLTDAPTLERYLDERAGLLIDPQLGST